MNKPNEITFHINLNITHQQEETIERLLRALLRGQERTQKSMSRLTDAVENMKTTVLDKLNEAVEIIRDPDQDSEQAAVLLEDFKTIVQNFDLTPDEVTPEP